ncbi:MAG: type II toxin-antitoxin system VapC family toxin [Angustibacter sp.]
MSRTVVDASVLAAFYGSDDTGRLTVRGRLGRGDALFAPAHLDAEVVSALRGMARSRPALARAVPGALAHLAALPLRRMPLAPLLARMWHLRQNVTPYDAAYVALAEQLGGPLLTRDARLASTARRWCSVELVT